MTCDLQTSDWMVSNWLLFRNEVCESGQLYKMCPVCDEDIGCEYWYLSDVCLFVKISYLFDHPGTVFYAVFVSFWGKFSTLHQFRKTKPVQYFYVTLSLTECHRTNPVEEIMQQHHNKCIAFMGTKYHHHRVPCCHGVQISSSCTLLPYIDRSSQVHTLSLIFRPL